MLKHVPTNTDTGPAVLSNISGVSSEVAAATESLTIRSSVGQIQLVSHKWGTWNNWKSMQISCYNIWQICIHVSDYKFDEIDNSDAKISSLCGLYRLLKFGQWDQKYHVYFSNFGLSLITIERKLLAKSDLFNPLCSALLTSVTCLK